MKPFTFGASEKSFKVQIDLKQGMVVTGISRAYYFWRFTVPFPVKKGDVFKAAPGDGLVVRGDIFKPAPFRGLIVNGKVVERNFISPKGKMPVNIGWVSKRLRVVAFFEKHGKKDKGAWIAADVRSYHVAQGSTSHEAIKSLLWTCSATNSLAEEERKKGRRVIRGRCLLPKAEAREMEEKARKHGVILDGVEVPKLKRA